MILQIVLVLAAVAALVYFVRSGQNVGIRAGKRIAFGGFVLLNIYAVLRPNDVTWVARHLGIGRGTDLVVYLLVMAFVFGMLNTYLRDREISQHLTDLARQLAIRDAELARREDELAARLAETSAALQGGTPANGSTGETTAASNGAATGETAVPANGTGANGSGADGSGAHGAGAPGTGADGTTPSASPSDRTAASRVEHPASE